MVLIAAAPLPTVWWAGALRIVQARLRKRCCVREKKREIDHSVLVVYGVQPTLLGMSAMIGRAALQSRGSLDPSLVWTLLE